MAYCCACGSHANVGLTHATTKAVPYLTQINCIITSHGIDFYAPLIRSRLAAHLYALEQWQRANGQSGSMPRTALAGNIPNEWDGTDIGEERDQT